LKGHTDIVWSVAFSSDGKTLISCGDDKTVRFWDVSTGAQVRRIEHSNGVGSIALSPDGKLLASVDWKKSSADGGSWWQPDTRIRIWDVATGKELRQLKVSARQVAPGVDAGVINIAFSADGETLVAGELGGVLRIWDPATGKERRRFDQFLGTVTAFAFAPRGRSLAVVDGQAAVRLIDLDSGKNLVTTHGHRSDVSSLSVTPDSRTVVTISYDRTLRFWELATGRELRQRTISGRAFDLCHFLANDQRYVASGADGLYWIHDVASGRELTPLRGLDTRRAFAISPDGKTLAVEGVDKTIRLLDPITGKPRHTLMKIDGVRGPGIIISADNRILVVWDSERLVTVWDTNTGKKLQQFTAPAKNWPASIPIPPCTAVLSADGRLLAFGFQVLVANEPGILPVVDTATGQEIRRLTVGQDGTERLAFSPDGRSLAWAGWRASTVYVGEIATGGQRRHFTGHRGRILSLAFAPDGKSLISGAQDTTAMVWDLTGRITAEDKWEKPLSAEELKTRWQILGGTDAAAAYRAMQQLAPDRMHSVPYLRERLHPVAVVKEKHLKELLADLASDQFNVRDKATLELERLGESALHAVRKALDDKPALEMRRRLERLIEKQERERWSAAPERLRTIRALEVLERAGTPEARRVLQALAAGAPGAWLTQDAKGALVRLGNPR
jgi:WD40 repeat protein